MNRRRCLLGLHLIVVGAILPLAQSIAQTYTVIDLAPTARSGHSFAINASGQTVGNVVQGTNQQHAFLYSAGSTLDLGTLPGDALSNALSINDSGEVVGWSDTGGNAGEVEKAISYSNGALVALFPTSVYSNATGINSAGTIVGGIYPSGTASYVYLYANGQTQNLGSIGTFAVTSINDTSQVAGTNASSSSAYAAYVWSNGQVTMLGTLGGLSSVANKINNVGQVVGWSNTAAGNQNAFLYSTGQMIGLGSLAGADTVANGLNNLGHAVGSTAGNATTGFLYKGAALIDLNTLINGSTTQGASVQIVGADAINDNDWIAADGLVGGSAQHPLLLIPVALKPSSLNFPNTAIGTITAFQSVALTNTGTAAFTIASIVISGEFSQTNTCGQSLASAATCTINVSFAPKDPGNLSGQLLVESGAAGLIVPLSGFSFPTTSLTASASTALAGAPITLTWTGSPGSTCVATGGASGDGWAGNYGATGKTTVTEQSAGTVTYTMSCGFVNAGSSAQVSVQYFVPAVTLSAAPSAVSEGQEITLNWSSTNSTSCAASGGTATDGWAGPKPTSGSAAVTESTAGTINFMMTCTSGSQSASATASISVVAPTAAHSGGGAFGSGELALLAASLLLRLLGGRQSRHSHSTSRQGYVECPS
jgi:probable HAF family extracellular repeat protein